MQWNITQPLKGKNSAICRDMDGSRDCHTEWTKSEKEKYHIASIWNLKNCYKWTYLQSKNRVMNVETILMNTKGGNFVIQSLSCVQLFVTPWTAACQASYPSLSPWVCSNSMSIELVMPAKHLILCLPLLLLPSIFPTIGVFSSESALCIRWPEYWTATSGSTLPMNIQIDFL